MAAIDPRHPLLSLCVRVDGCHNSPELARLAGQFTAWSTLATEAEMHGLAPLLYTHLTTGGIGVPGEVKRDLLALYLRHRHANQVRGEALAEILACYNAAGIPALVLKGAALAYLVYPQPGLRPMRDLDILVARSDARRAQQLLAGLGFAAPLPPADTLPGKHLEPATRASQGISISVEIHHNLFSPAGAASLELVNLATPPVAFRLAGLTAYTLGYEEMLWHLCHHLILLRQPLRLIWVADIIGTAERFVTLIDWDRVKGRYPTVLSTLSLLHHLTPLPDSLLTQAPIRVGPSPAGIAQDFQGWPRRSLAEQRAKGWQAILADTFSPPEWWLRLYYGLGSTGRLFWYRWAGHPWQVCRWAGQLLLERAGLRKPM